MHQKSNDKPTQGQLILPLLEELKAAGGSAKAKDVAQSLADRFGLPDAVREETVQTGDGQTVNLWRRHVRFARQKALQMGYVDKTGQPGIWSLTDEGTEGIDKAAPAVQVTVHIDAAGRPVSAQIELAVGIPTVHTLHLGDARDLSWIGRGEIPLIVTSCPYFDLKNYGNDAGQLALLPSYEAFLDGLDEVMAECNRVLVPGGRMIWNVGDVLRSRKAKTPTGERGSHHILPLHADIQVRSRNHGFQALNGIIWQKLSNVRYEQGAGGVLGKPCQPNNAIKLEIEHLLVMRKPGPYRSPSAWQREASAISREEQRLWYRPVWSDIPGTNGRDIHPAQFPVALPSRLIRMFSFAGETVLDVFGGRFTTSIAAMKTGRHSAATEISPAYFDSGMNRLVAEANAIATAA